MTDRSSTWECHQHIVMMKLSKILPHAWLGISMHCWLTTGSLIVNADTIWHSALDIHDMLTLAVFFDFASFLRKKLKMSSIPPKIVGYVMWLWLQRSSIFTVVLNIILIFYGNCFNFCLRRKSIRLADKFYKFGSATKITVVARRLL